MLCRAFENKLYFKDIKFPVKVRHIYNIEKKKKNFTEFGFLAMKIKKNTHFMWQKILLKNISIYNYWEKKGKNHFDLVKRIHV